MVRPAALLRSQGSLPTLMHDPVYRLGIAWQNVGYNQPAHPGFYLGHEMPSPRRSGIMVPMPGHLDP